MPERFETIRATVLNRQHTSEHYLLFHCFDVTQGAWQLLYRQARKQVPPPPDLFDSGLFVLEAGRGASWFIKEFRLERHRLAIARNYTTFQCASDFVNLFCRNTVHLHDPEEPAKVLKKALDAFEGGIRPDITLFKSLYLLARSEGLPVKEHFIQELASPSRTLALELLNRPLSEQTALEAKVTALIQQMKKWLVGHADFLIAPSSLSFPKKP